MKTRPVNINQEKCNGCGVCVDNCPMDVLRLNESLVAYVRYPDDCWYCGCCEVECCTGAVEVTFPYLVL